MLRIGNWYEARMGRNDGNPLYVTACLKRMQYYGEILSGRPPNQELLRWFTNKELDPTAEKAARELWDKEKVSIEIDHFYPTGEVAPFGIYDLNIWVDWGEDALKGILPYDPIFPPHPLVYWTSDTHIQTSDADSYLYRLSMAKKADLVFCAQKRAVEQMKQDGISNPLWLPHAVEPLAYPTLELAEKKYDVCFVGHMNSSNRMEALDCLFKEFPNFYYGQALFEEAARKYSESRICFNIAMTDDINMRTFEVMATKSFLLTNWIPTIEEFFEDGKHLVFYRSLDEMIDKAKYYLAHDEEREKIAQAGYEEVISKHKIQDRVNLILKTFLESRKVEMVS